MFDTINIADQYLNFKFSIHGKPTDHFSLATEASKFDGDQYDSTTVH